MTCMIFFKLGQSVPVTVLIITQKKPVLMSVIYRVSMCTAVVGVSKGVSMLMSVLTT